MQKDLNILRYEDAAACLPVRLRKAAMALEEERDIRSLMALCR